MLGVVACMPWLSCQKRFYIESEIRETLQLLHVMTQRKSIDNYSEQHCTPLGNKKH